MPRPPVYADKNPHTYLLRGIPRDVWRRASTVAELKGEYIRDVLIDKLGEYVAASEWSPEQLDKIRYAKQFGGK